MIFGIEACRLYSSASKTAEVVYAAFQVVDSNPWITSSTIFCCPSNINHDTSFLRRSKRPPTSSLSFTNSLRLLPLQCSRRYDGSVQWRMFLEGLLEIRRACVAGGECQAAFRTQLVDHRRREDSVMELHDEIRLHELDSIQRNLHHPKSFPSLPFEICV